MHRIVKNLLAKKPVILDGAWGTQLQNLGLPLGIAVEEWNLTHPEKVELVAKSYVKAGSDIILTNSFGGSGIKLNNYKLKDKAFEINKAAAEISKRAAGNKATVFGSIGPSGKMLIMGDVTEDELYQSFLEQAKAMKAGGADGLVIETMADIEEAKIALKAAKETELAVAVCMTYDSGKNKDRTMMGVSPEQAAETLTDAGADIIGSNCGQGIEGFISICKMLKNATDKPIWIKANAGLPQMKNCKTVFPTTPKIFASYIPELVKAGADFVGGCCGTSPEFIKTIIENK